MLSKESADREHEALADVDAALQFVSAGLQGLLELLASAPPDAAVRAGGLHALLGPVADQAGQAAPVARMLLERRAAAASAGLARRRRGPGRSPAPPCNRPCSADSVPARCARIGPTNSIR